MAKSKNRAARKLERERAARADERGLPRAQSAGRDDATWADSPGARARVRGAYGTKRTNTSSSGGRVPPLLKVAVAVVVVLVAVFIASEGRKADLLQAPSTQGSGPASSGAK